jgi:hypothetical protein
MSGKKQGGHHNWQNGNCKRDGDVWPNWCAAFPGSRTLLDIVERGICTGVLGSMAT